MNTIEFECVSKLIYCITIRGYVYVDVCREHLASYLTDKLDVSSFSPTLEQELDNGATNEQLFIMTVFLGRNTGDFHRYLVANGYEEEL